TRDLPPFPTRRSSDLGMTRQQARRALRLRVQQRADVVREYLRSLPIAHIDAQPPLRIEQERSGGMIHAVAAGCGSRLLLVEHLRSEEHTSELQSLAYL